MKNSFRYSLFLLLFFFMFETTAQQAWKIQEGYEIAFEGGKVSGTFDKMSGSISFDPQRFADGKFDILIDPASINTGNSTMDKHARGDNWFDVEKYPEIRFRSTSVTEISKGYQLKGILSLHGIEKESSIVFALLQRDGQDIFEGKMEINRQAFGIEGPWFGGFAVKDDFMVKIKVPVVKE